MRGPERQDRPTGILHAKGGGEIQKFQGQAFMQGHSHPSDAAQKTFPNPARKNFSATEISLKTHAHHGVDQQTLEARAYAVARHFKPLLVNTVVGFIGPEYLFDGKQIIRAGLEDHFCGKLLGLPLGIFGAHRFYAGKVGSGVVMLCTLGGLGLWWLADCVVIATEHSSVEYGMICREARAVVDTRNALARYVKS